MTSFESDYNNGMLPEILERLAGTNQEKATGYGFDPYCESAREKIRTACGKPEADVYFLLGGTQTNATVIDSLLIGCEGVLTVESGHINVHESGAVEASGHKVLVIPGDGSKVTAEGLDGYMEAFHADETYPHMVQPRLVHDCAKYMPLEDMIDICERNFVELNELEKKKNSLLHSKAGACLAYEKYGIKDKEILDAIKYHTTGRPDMSLIEKIIFVSDFIEPGRDFSEKLPMYRMIAMADINLVCMNILKDTLDYLEARNEEIEPLTKETYAFYKNLINERNNK